MDKIIRKQAKTAAATNIQKVVRGHKVRKQLPEIMEEVDRQAIIDKINQVEQRANRMDKAAITIQKRARGMNTRADVKNTAINYLADDLSSSVVYNSVNKIKTRQAAATLQSAMRRKTDMMKKDNQQTKNN